MNDDEKRNIAAAKELICETFPFLSQANELLHKIPSERIEAVNEALCFAIAELKGCAKAL